jgi:hypothetical protein
MSRHSSRECRTGDVPHENASAALFGDTDLPGLCIVMGIAWERRVDASLAGKWRRIDVNRRSRDIGGLQDASDLDHVPPRGRPGARKAAGKDTGASCAPDFVRFNRHRSCRLRYSFGRELSIDTEGDKGSANSLAILARAGLNDGKITWLNGNDLRSEPCGFKRAWMWANALRHEDRRLLAELLCHCCKRCLRTPFRRACIDRLVSANEERAHEARFRPAGIEIVSNDKHAVMVN